jgi:hypothetical protein
MMPMKKAAAMEPRIKAVLTLLRKTCSIARYFTTGGVSKV